MSYLRNTNTVTKCVNYNRKNQSSILNTLFDSLVAIQVREIVTFLAVVKVLHQ